MESACQIIVGYKLIALDLEGFDLGKFGKISTIQIATADTGYQFVFDIITLSGNPSQRSDILKNDKIMKLMFDCRNDSAALLTEYGIHLNGIIDLQLKEIMQRTDSTDEARRRLHGPLYHRNVEGNPAMYTDVIRHSSLLFLLKEYGVSGYETKEVVSGTFKGDDHY